jgi:hypothetical protein
MSDALPPIPPETPMPSVAVSVDGRISEDKICIDCGYNLRGLNTDGRCPECGGEVAASLRGHELHYASLPWLHSVRRGFHSMKIAILLSLLVIIGITMIQIAWQATKSSRGLPATALFLMTSVSMTLTSLLGLYGMVLATRAEPRVAHQGEGWSFRRWARLLTVAALALWGGLELLSRLGPKTGWVDQVMVYAPLVLAVLVPLVVAAFVQHVIALLERTADAKTLKQAKQTQQFVYLAVALAALVLVMNTLAQIYRSDAEIANRIGTTAGAARGCWSCVCILFGLGALQLIWRTSKVFDGVVTTAEADARLRSTAGTPPAGA